MSGEDLVLRYTESLDPLARQRLGQAFKLASAILPGVQFTISYGVVKLYYGTKGYVAYMGGYKDFISMYPVHLVQSHHSEDLQPYIHGKATARFYHNQPLPKELIRQLLLSLKEDYDRRIRT